MNSGWLGVARSLQGPSAFDVLKFVLCRRVLSLTVPIMPTWDLQYSEQSSAFCSHVRLNLHKPGSLEASRVFAPAKSAKRLAQSPVRHIIHILTGNYNVSVALYQLHSLVCIWATVWQGTWVRWWQDLHHSIDTRICWREVSERPDRRPFQDRHWPLSSA